MKFILKKKKERHVHIYNNLKGRVLFIGEVSFQSQRKLLYFSMYAKFRQKEEEVEYITYPPKN